MGFMEENVPGSFNSPLTSWSRQRYNVIHHFKEINLTFDEIIKSSKLEINSE